MKTNKLKPYLKLGILIFGSCLILINCQTDSETFEPIQVETDFTIKPKFETFSLQQLEKDVAFNNLKNTYGILQNKPQFKYANRNSSSARLVDTLGITIDASTIKKIVYDNYVSFTMLMIEPDDTSGNFSNLVVQEYNGEKQIFTVRYITNQTYSDKSSHTSRSSTKSFSNIQMRSGITTTELWPTPDEDDGGSSSSGNCDEYERVCYTVNVWIPVCCGCGHCGDAPCSGCYGNYAGWTLGIEEECENICILGSPDNDPTTGTGNSTGSGSTPSSSTEPTDVATTPVNPDGASASGNMVANMLNSLLTDEEKMCIENSKNVAFADQVLIYLSDDENSTQSLTFAALAVSSNCNGGEVDFVNEVILDKSFLDNECLKTVYDAMGKATAFNNYLQNFEGEFSVAHLRFKYDENFEENQPDYTNALAITEPPLGTENVADYNITITFNGDVNLTSSIHGKSKLIIAVSFIHEMIHAEIFRKMLSAAQLGHLDTENMTPEQQVNFVNNLLNNFEGIWDYYVDRWREDWGHQLMAQHYVDIIVSAISEYDNNAHSLATYEALAWVGLYDTIAWNNLTPEQQTAHETNRENFENNDTDICN